MHALCRWLLSIPNTRSDRRARVRSLSLSTSSRRGCRYSAVLCVHGVLGSTVCSRASCDCTHGRSSSNRCICMHMLPIETSNRTFIATSNGNFPTEVYRNFPTEVYRNFPTEFYRNFQLKLPTKGFQREIKTSPPALDGSFNREPRALRCSRRWWALSSTVAASTRRARSLRPSAR